MKPASLLMAEVVRMMEKNQQFHLLSYIFIISDIFSHSTCHVLLC